MKELRQQLVSALLVIVTVAAVVAAAINLQQQNKFHLPDDGVTWLDQSQGAGQNYWIVANGIRLTGMPGYRGSLSELQLWQVSQYLSNRGNLPDSAK